MDKITAAENKRRIQLSDMRARLAELEDTLHAIRSGEVDALIVNGPNGDQVYSLKGAEQPYRDFIEEMQEGAITLDPAGTILYCNRSFAQMLATPLERVISSKLADHISPDHRLLVDSMLADTGAATANVVLFVNGGKHLSVRFAVNPLTTDARGEAVARCLVVTDLTEQHERKFLTEALHRLQKSQEDLQKQYVEVQAVRAKLEQANAAKDEFLAALSHELRTPLTPVLLTANAMAVDPSLPAELRGDLEMIRRNVELEARLIDDLLDLTRITTGKLKINPTSIDLHDILRLALDICQSDTAAKRVRFAIHFDATYHYVSAEAVRLQQVFWNLIRNAVKFTPGSGQITVSTKNAKKSGKDTTPAIIITVSDTGMGIAPDSLDRIFNAFEQGSSEITRRFGGLGLGLTITSRIIDLHGGKITAASKGAGHGSTFTITLPTVPTPSRSAPVPAANKPAPAQSLRILLVEDHDDTRRNMTRLLTALNHTVVPAHDAASALARASEETFDLVVSDIGLPDESGLELMKKLRGLHKLRGICLSGYGMEEDVAKSLAAGFLEHLTKPINFQRLESAINKAASAVPPAPPRPPLDPASKIDTPARPPYNHPRMPVTTYLLFATLLPFAGFLLLIFFGKRFRRLAGPFSALLLLGSFALSIGALVTWVAKPEYNHAHYVEALTYRWIPLPAHISAALPGVDVGQDDTLTPNPLSRPALAIGFLVDSLTITMFLIITFLAFLVHLFSITYMARDARFPRYFAYLGLFCFSMLSLILANSLLQIFFFWQLTTIASWLLISFWFERRAPATASLKSFLLQRLGDVSFLIGLGILVMHAGPVGLTLFDSEGTSLLVEGVRNSLNMGSSEFLYLTSNAAIGNAGFLGLHWLTWVGLCLFGGAVAKSAQFPLHVWFPDAMEAPAPVSALVHATTMVAAGVYLIARIYPILTMDARLVIAIIGCITILFGALLALVQTDLKRLLAYITLSQVGYMMLFLGAGGYVAGLLHLCTFAFFNACLFLAAGSVIHALGHEQRLEQMGGLWKKLPITALAFLIAALALIGVPFSSGAYSSQLGLAVVYDYARALIPSSAGHRHYVMLLFWIPALTLFLTAFAMGRGWWLTFAGKNRNEPLYDDAYESGLLTFPLIILSILCAGVWFEFFHMPDLLHKSLLLDRGLLGKALAVDATDDLLNHMTAHTGTYFFLAVPLAALLAIPLYFSGFRTATKLRKLPVLNLLYIWFREKLYLDALYNGVVVTLVLFTVRLAKFFDRYLLDAVLILVTLLLRAAARLIAFIDSRLIDPLPDLLATAGTRTFRFVKPRPIDPALPADQPPTP